MYQNMKTSTVILLLFIGFLSAPATAQKITWLDKNKQETSKKNHEYYRIQEFEGTLKTFYKTGELFEQGNYNNQKKEGVWKTFYKNGKIKTKGKYRNNEKVGVWKTFYKNVY